MSNTTEWDLRHTPVTVSLVAVAAVLEIVATVAPDRRDLMYVEYLGILSSIWQGELWRPFTTTLLHANLLHAGFNIYWVLRFGPALEHRFGSPLMAVLLVLLGYVSMLPQFIVTNYHQPVDAQIPIVGLSGVLYGLFGILMIGRRKHPQLDAVCDERTEQFLLFWLVLCVFLTWQGLLPVANLAHAAGLGFGLLFGLALFDAARRRMWTIIAAAATLAVLATLVAVPGHEGYEYSRRFAEQEAR